MCMIFFVDYDNTGIDDILDIHTQLMKKNDINIWIN